MIGNIQTLAALQKEPSISVLLVDDQLIVAEALKQILKPQKHIVLHHCQDASVLKDTIKKVRPSVILQDLMMPGVDGLDLVKDLKQDPLSKNIPLVVLSSKEEPLIKSKAFSLGANDYLVKLPDPLELQARIQYHSNAYFYWLERNQAFAKIKQDLAQAAKYVQSMLPAFLGEEEKIETNWVYRPSDELGGDAFSYHWIDENHLAVYLLDVCGHGVGAALLSVSAMNVLRSHSLLGVDFKQPAQVLQGLDKIFNMETQNGMYFTIWYGVYAVKERLLTYASAGHPAAILVDPSYYGASLATEGMIIGTDFKLPFTQAQILVKPRSSLYLFSDGVFEVIEKEDGQMMGPDIFAKILQINKQMDHKQDVQKVLSFVQAYQGRNHFDDDFSLLRLYFK